MGRLGWVLSRGVTRSDLCLITFEAIVWRKVSRMQTRRWGGEWGGWSNEPIQLVNQSVNKPLWSPTFVPGLVLGAEDRPRAKRPCSQGAPRGGVRGRGEGEEWAA